MKPSSTLRLLRLAAMAALLAVAGIACAASPAARWYRFRLGSDSVVALSDGSGRMDVYKVLRHARPGEIARALQQHGLQVPVATAFNAFLVDTGDRRVLIDTGNGSGHGATVGHLLASLRAAGYRPGQIDEVLITHMHPDHIGGLVAAGRRVFPNALLRVSQAEADYWLSRQQMRAAPAAARAGFERAMAAVAPYRAAHRFATFTGAATLAPGITAVPLHGHTPGHTGYMVRSDGQRLLVWGDIVHVAAVQFADPAVTVTYDSNPSQAAATRRDILARAAAQGFLVAGAHIAFPGVGHVRRRGKGYVWVPLPGRGD